MIEIDHLSYSSISTYLSCPRYWRFKYIDRVPTATTPALVFGSAFHETIESYIARGAGRAGGLDVTSMWLTHWHLALEKNPCIEWGQDTPEALCNEGLRMLQHPEISSVLQAIEALPLDNGGVAIEQKVELRVPGVPVPVVGYIDLIEKDGLPADFKTSARSWSAARAQGEIQPVFYLAALNQNGWPLPRGLQFRYFVFVKTKTPQIQMWTVEHEPGMLFWLFGLIGEVWQAIDRGAFPPNPTTWKHSPQYCEYWDLCMGGGQ